ncbi:MAG: hypothetical protein IJZ16_01150 [Clostridia bacterium]|nr:hypothetical protein [Clostridia bacterium]
MDIKFILDNIDDKNGKNTQDNKIFRKNTTQQITIRDKKYTNLLSHFVKVTCFRNWVKEIFKWTFLVCICMCMICLFAFMYLLFKKYLTVVESIDDIVKSAPLLITSIVSIVTTIIGIPTIITKYLFSTSEDEYITRIILHTQEHDTSGRKWATESTSSKDIAQSSKIMQTDSKINNNDDDFPLLA